MNRIFAIIIFAIGIASISNAQEQRNVYTQHFLNPVLVNPGATGFGDDYNILINYANKWAGFDGGPRSLTLSYDGPIANRLSLGGMIFRDAFASLESIKGQLSFAYKIPADMYEVSFGLTTEYHQYGLQGSSLNSSVIDTDDPELRARLQGARFFDVSAGAYGTYNENITFGLVLPGLVRARLDDGSGESTRTVNYVAHVGYKYDVPNYDFYIEPSFFVKQLRNTPFHTDINVKLGFMEDQLIGGLSYGIGYDRLGFLLGTKVNNFKVFYSYNVSLEESQSYHNGMHEFTLGFTIGKPAMKPEMEN